MEFLQLAVLGADPAHRAGDRTHHHRLGLDDVAAETHALEHGAGGHACRREQAVAPYHVLDLVALAHIVDAHFERALAPLLGVEHEPALHLTADAAQRRGREYPFGRATDT